MITLRPIMLFQPGVGGANLVWPVTCIILPPAAAFWQPTTKRMRWVFLGSWRDSGGVTVYLSDFPIMATSPDRDIEPSRSTIILEAS